MTKVVDIADELFRFGNQTDFSIPAISFWIRSNLGTLNNLINTSFYVDKDTLEIKPCFGENEAAILKSLFTIYWIGFRIKGSLGAAGYNSALEVTSNGATVRLASKTEIAKTYLQEKRLEEDNLKTLIIGYKSGKSLPSQVAGDDTCPGIIASTPYVFNREI